MCEMMPVSLLMITHDCWVSFTWEVLLCVERSTIGKGSGDQVRVGQPHPRRHAARVGTANQRHIALTENQVPATDLGTNYQGNRYL